MVLESIWFSDSGRTLGSSFLVDTRCDQKAKDLHVCLSFNGNNGSEKVRGMATGYYSSIELVLEYLQRNMSDRTFYYVPDEQEIEKASNGYLKIGRAHV